jgi:hypothetical protein
MEEASMGLRLGAVAVLMLALAVAARVTGEGLALESIDATAFPRLNCRVILEAVAPRAPNNADWVVEENGVEADAIGVAADARPLAVAFVVECSRGQEPELELATEALRSVVDQLKPDARATIIPFAAAVPPVRAFTSDHKVLHAQLRALVCDDGAAVCDALTAALREGGSLQPQHRVEVVCFSQGREQNATHTGRGSHVTAAAVVEQARTLLIPIHMVGLGPGARATVLERFARYCGGTYRTLAPPAVGPVVGPLNGLLQSAYALTYRSPNPTTDGSFRRIDLRSTLAGLSTATAGYMAPYPDGTPTAALTTGPALGLSTDDLVVGRVRVAEGMGGPIAQTEILVNERLSGFLDRFTALRRRVDRVTGRSTVREDDRIRLDELSTQIAENKERLAATIRRNRDDMLAAMEATVLDSDQRRRVQKGLDARQANLAARFHELALRVREKLKELQ